LFVVVGGDEAEAEAEAAGDDDAAAGGVVGSAGFGLLQLAELITANVTKRRDRTGRE
jgi:hypothetical protein